MKTTTNRRRKRASRSAALPRFRTDHLVAVRSFLADRDDVCEGRMFGYPAFFVGRRMFACVYGEGVGIKVPAELAACLLERTDTEPFRPYGKATMKEWVQINHARANDYQADLSVFLASVRFAADGQESGGRS